MSRVDLLPPGNGSESETDGVPHAAGLPNLAYVPATTKGMRALGDLSPFGSTRRFRRGSVEAGGKDVHIDADNTSPPDRPSLGDPEG